MNGLLTDVLAPAYAVLFVLFLGNMIIGIRRENFWVALGGALFAGSFLFLFMRAMLILYAG